MTFPPKHHFLYLTWIITIEPQDVQHRHASRALQLFLRRFIRFQYHADSGGSFEIVSLQEEDGGGGALMQMSPLYPSMTEWVADYDPITSLGDANWTVTFWRSFDQHANVCCSTHDVLACRVVSVASNPLTQDVNVSVRVQVAAAAPKSSTRDTRIIWPDDSFVLRQSGDDPISSGIYGECTAPLCRRLS